jgi:hypothetical protein
MPSASQFENVDRLRNGWLELEKQLRSFVLPLSDQDLERVLERVLEREPRLLSSVDKSRRCCDKRAQPRPRAWISSPSTESTRHGKLCAP